MRDIMTELAYLELYHEQIEANRKLDSFKKKLITESKLKSSNTIYTESQFIDAMKYNMEVLNEEDVNTFKQNFAKFTQAVQNMLQRFMDYSNKMMAKNKEYLARMKDAITTPNKGENIPIEMRNYPEGIKRIKMNLPTFEAVKSRITNPGDKNMCIQEMQKALMPSYTNANIDFKEHCKIFFQGSKNKISTNINNINMDGVYQYCANFQAIINSINNNINAVQSVAKYVEKMGANAGQITTPNAAIQAQNASAIIGGYSHILEAPDQQDNGRISIDKSQNTNAVPSQPAQVQQAVQQQQAVQAGQKADDQTANDINVVNAYKTVALQVLGAKMHSANIIYNDYIQLMKARAPENGGGNAPSLKLANPAGMVNRINAILKIIDKNQQASATQGLLNEIKKTNPQFNGGLSDVMRAAQAAAK